MQRTDYEKIADRFDVSQLTLISEEVYARGLARIRAILAADPGAQSATEEALVWCMARQLGNPGASSWRTAAAR
jgi:hypothetical protein